MNEQRLAFLELLSEPKKDWVKTEKCYATQLPLCSKAEASSFLENSQTTYIRSTKPEVNMVKPKGWCPRCYFSVSFWTSFSDSVGPRGLLGKGLWLRLILLFDTDLSFTQVYCENLNVQNSSWNPSKCKIHPSFPAGIFQALVIWWHLIIIEPPVWAIKVSPVSIKDWVRGGLAARTSSHNLRIFCKHEHNQHISTSETL